MNMRYFSPLLAVVLFATATVAQAAVHRVYPGDSIQIAIDGASPGDTILVEPGTYVNENPDESYGLRITKDNLRLIGKVKKGQGEAGKVRLLYNGEYYDNDCPEKLSVEKPTDADKELCGAGQRTGIYAAPAACGPEVPVGGCADELQDFYIRGFTVQKFPGNGIQTRFVNGFKIIRNESADNLHNGIYPTISANGLVQNNISYGALDTAMWVAASQNVRVIGNDLSGSPIGLEVNVSLDIVVRHNDIHDNTVGIGLFHPNTAGNDPLPVMGNWVVEHNNVYDNNLFPNPAPPGSFQGDLPPGVGILVLGVSDNVVAKNTVENNDFVGIGVLGWCTAASTIEGRDCFSDPPIRGGVFQDPSVSNNLIAQNKVSGNGTSPPGPPGPLDFLAADLTYFSAGPDAGEFNSGNCFMKNKPSGFTYFSSEPDGELPTDGC
jgi:hypothetical protein